MGGSQHWGRIRGFPRKLSKKGLPYFENPIISVASPQQILWTWANRFRFSFLRCLPPPRPRPPPPGLTPLSSTGSRPKRPSRARQVSPSSDCPWDAWLEATHAWPHLKLKLPGDFCRKGAASVFSEGERTESGKEADAERVSKQDLGRCLLDRPAIYRS